MNKMLARGCGAFQLRRLSTGTASSDPLDLYDRVISRLEELAPGVVAPSLERQGCGFCVLDNFTGGDWASLMQSEAEVLRPRFVQSYSEVQRESSLERFDKEGVFALELDGNEKDARCLLHYTAGIMHSLPGLLNHFLREEGLKLSSSTYGTKLAVTEVRTFPQVSETTGCTLPRCDRFFFFSPPGQWVEIS